MDRRKAQIVARLEKEYGQLEAAADWIIKLQDALASVMDHVGDSWDSFYDDPDYGLTEKAN